MGADYKPLKRVDSGITRENYIHEMSFEISAAKKRLVEYELDPNHNPKVLTDRTLSVSKLNDICNQYMDHVAELEKKIKELENAKT